MTADMARQPSDAVRGSPSREVRLQRASGLDGLVLERRDPPVPGHGQVLIRVHAASLNYRDLIVPKGEYPGRPGTGIGLVPLSDGAGEVVAIGSGVTGFKPGDRVSASCQSRWQAGPLRSSYLYGGLGIDMDGFLTDHAAIDERTVVRLPDYLSFEEAATLPCAGVTAWHALMTGMPLMPGMTVLVLGSGGVSIFALQFAKLFGARVIATTSSDAKAERLRALGADAVVNYRTTPDWSVEVRKLTHGLGVDKVIEIGGGDTLEHSMRSAGIGGSIAMIGYVSGQSKVIDLAPLPAEATVTRTAIGSRSDFEAMLAAMQVNGIRPVIDRVFPFDDFRHAYRYLESGSHVGKVVVKMI